MSTSGAAEAAPASPGAHTAQDDLESQRGPPARQPSLSAASPVSTIRSPLSRLSWNVHKKEQGAVDRGRHSRHVSRSSTAASMAAPPRTSATLFNVQDRPDLQLMESYVVGDPSASPMHRSSTFHRRSSQNRGMSLLRSHSSSSSTHARRSRSQVRTHKLSEEEAHGVTAIGYPSKADQDILRVDARGVPPSEIRRPTPPDQGATPSVSVAATAADTLRDASKHRQHSRQLSDIGTLDILKKLPKPLLPVVHFPGQGTGRMSEFAQDAPIWAEQPFKSMYFAYFGLSVGLIFLPWFAAVSVIPSQRERPSWTWKKNTLVRLFRHGSRLTFRTHTSLSRDLSKEVPHSKTIRAKFVWVDALPDNLIRGELKRALGIQELPSLRTCGFWYGERDGGGGVGQKAAPGEKVVYHLHGGAYWIGTAHEKDVTAAVNVQVLKALDAIYTSRLPPKDQGATELEGRRSPHPANGPPSAGDRGLCKRAFSLDYRLCVPGCPEIGSFPAPLVDTLAGYRYLVQECEFDPENIIVAGDSAGGNLAMALCRYLRDEKLDELPMPGAMILLSPWVDTSRSHSGPVSAPNKFSTVYKNRKSDIIAPSSAYRNTAVSALIGNLPARETYRNPYLSPVSLQLSAADGGVGPHWGFEGFPRRIYLCTGTAEVSHDQHLTLAFRLAGGTKRRIPIFRGDRCSEQSDAHEMAARLRYPRPEDYELTLWPSAQNTPTPYAVMSPEVMSSSSETAWTRESKAPESRGNGATAEKSQVADDSPAIYQSHNDDRAAKRADAEQDKTRSTARSLAAVTVDVATGAMDAVRSRVPLANGDGLANENAAAAAQPNFVKEKDTERGGNSTHSQSRRQQESKGSGALPNGHGHPNTSSSPASGNRSQKGKDASKTGNGSGSPTSYFASGGEDRTVVLDECIDAMHDYFLFDWFEPERGQTWARIAQWIDEET